MSQYRYIENIPLKSYLSKCCILLAFHLSEVEIWVNSDSFLDRSKVGSKNKSGYNTECGLNATTQKGDFAKSLVGQGYSFPDAFRTRSEQNGESEAK